MKLCTQPRLQERMCGCPFCDSWFQGPVTTVHLKLMHCPPPSPLCYFHVTSFVRVHPSDTSAARYGPRGRRSTTTPSPCSRCSSSCRWESLLPIYGILT